MQNQTRIVIENVLPQLDCGINPIKRIVNQKVNVTADVFSDGHDVVECCVKFKHENDTKWQEVRMVPKGNDEWFADFKVEKQGFYTYFVDGWIDHALNWQHGTGFSFPTQPYMNCVLPMPLQIYKAFWTFTMPGPACCKKKKISSI